MAYTAINDPTKHFNTSLYTGNEIDDRPVIGVGFQPDLLWIKERSVQRNHNIADSTRGVTKHLSADLDEAEATGSNRIKSFDSDGFTVGDSGYTNDVTETFASWNWLANGGTRTTFSEVGDNPAGGYQVNTTAGFSIIDYTGTGANGTVAHGLGVAPKCIIIKRRNDTESWIVGHDGIVLGTGRLQLDSDVANGTGNADAYYNTTAPSSTVVSLGDHDAVNGNDDTYIIYAFAPIQGYSKFGSYRGNENNGDGTFVYTGFAPSFIMVKNTERAQNWSIHNNKIPGYNEVKQRLQANLSAVEATNNPVDLLSNGFKWRSNDGDTNGYTHIHIYMAFAESPFVTSNGSPGNAK